MSHSDRSGPKKRHSWKQVRTPAGRAPTPESKHLGRWILTLAIPILVAIFVVLLLINKWGDRHLVILPIGSTDPLTLPLKPFAAEDIRAVRQVSNVVVHEAPEAAQDESTLDGYLSSLAKIPQGKRDVLLVYVSAHGVSEDGRPYLVCRDFNRAGTSGKYEIKRFLDALAACPGQLKLLILDAGGLDYDPRLGIVGNEFPYLLADEVKKLPSQELWVLLSNGGSQVNAVSHLDRRSVFSKAVTDGLDGAANTSSAGNGDSYVDLHELHQYVTDRCQSWFGPELPGYQTPVLLKAGEGTDFDSTTLRAAQHRLLYLSGKKAEPPSDASKSEPASPPPDVKPTKTAGQSRPKAALNRSVTSALGPSTLALGQAANQTDQAASFGKETEKSPPVGANDKTAEVAEKKSASSEEPVGSAQASAASENPQAAAADEKQPPTEKTTPENSSPDKPASDKPPSSKSPGPEASPSKSSPAPRAGKKEDPSAVVRRELHDELRRLWQIRDKLMRRDANGVSPIDFAPHLWRETEAWILYYESRIRSSLPIATPPDRSTIDPLLADMRTLAKNMESLSDAIASGNAAVAADVQSIGYRLADAWNRRYLVERLADAQRFEREAPSGMIEIRQAVRGLWERLYRAADFVHWFGHANTTLPSVDRHQKLIADYLDHLAQWLALHNDLAGSSLTATDQLRINQFIEADRIAGTLEQAIANVLLDIEQESLSRPHDGVAQRRMVELLSTPLLTADRRMTLLEALSEQKPSAQSASDEAPSGSNVERVSPRLQVDWRRLRACLELEQKLIAFHDSSTAAAIERLLQDADSEIRRGTEGDYSAEFHGHYRGALKLIRAFYTGLPRVTKNEFVLHAVDPRDALLVDAGKFPLPQLRIAMEAPSELRLEPVAKTVKLDENLEGRLSVTLVASKPALLDTRVVPANPDNMLVFEKLPEGEELPIERGLYRRTVHWRLSAKRTAGREGKYATQVRLAARYGDSEANTAVEITLPQPNRVDVFFSRLGVPGDAGGESTTIPLELIANRETKFLCKLANQHDEPKTVEVLLYAIAPRPFARAPIGKLDESIRNSVYDPGNRVFIDAKLIAKSSPIALPGKQLGVQEPVRVPVEFGSASPPPPPPASPDGKPTATPPPQPKPAAEPIHGLALTVIDKQHDQQWLKWIELAPLAPREYLHADIGYDQRLQQIVASFRPKEGRLPPGKPIELVWDIAGANLPEQGMRQLRGQLAAAAGQPTVTLRAAVPVDDKPHEIKISADGYPRAFYYRVICRRDATGPALLPGDDLARERTAIRIESVSVDKQPVVYHFPPHKPAAPEEAKPESKEPAIAHRYMSARQPALFSGPADTLTVHLEADAPIDAFTSEADRVRVRLRENESAREIQATRDLNAFFVEAGAGGVIELSTTVSDLSIPLSVGSLENEATVVNAEIKFGNKEDVSQIEVQFDGHAPSIRAIDSKNPVVKGATARFQFRVDEAFGVDRVVYGFSKDGTNRLPEAGAASRAIEAQRSAPGQYTFTLELNTKDIDVGKHRLVAAVVDLVGKESEVAPADLIIVEPPKPVALKGEIRGAIKAGRSSVTGALFDLTIEGEEIGTRPVPIQANGTFVVRDLSPGEYVLKPRGSVAGRTVKEKEFKVKLVDPKKGVDTVLDVAN